MGGKKHHWRGGAVKSERNTTLEEEEVSVLQAPPPNERAKNSEAKAAGRHQGEVEKSRRSQKGPNRPRNRKGGGDGRGQNPRTPPMGRAVTAHCIARKIISGRKVPKKKRLWPKKSYIGEKGNLICQKESAGTAP